MRAVAKKKSTRARPAARQTILLRQIQRAQSRIMKLAPYRDIGLEPNPPASAEAIAVAEARLGVALPQSYKAFLMQYDGWPRFWEGATLLGTASLGRRDYEDLARSILLATETPTSEATTAPSSRNQPRRSALVPFGIDVQGTTLFAFEGGETVVAWVNEIGLRRESFDDFLESILELAEAELEERGAGLLKTG
jgi:hypothetical protein